MNPNIDLSKSDLNIVKSLDEIKWPLKNNNGNFVFLTKDRYDHIAVKRHFLKVRDIKSLDKILLNPIKIINCDYRKNKIYFGRRKGTSGNNNYPFLQIVVKIIKTKEFIWTIYPCKNLNEKFSHYY